MHVHACTIFPNTTTADGYKEVSFGENSFLVHHIMYSNHTHICTSIMNGQMPQQGGEGYSCTIATGITLKFLQQIIKETLAN